MPEMSGIPWEGLRWLNGKGSMGAAPRGGVPERLSQLGEKNCMRACARTCVYLPEADDTFDTFNLKKTEFLACPHISFLI